jgi:hypothetical protein
MAVAEVAVEVAEAEAATPAEDDRKNEKTELEICYII